MSYKAKWALEGLEISDMDKVEKENYKFIEKWKSRDDYLKDPEILLRALREYEKLTEMYGVGGNEMYKLGLESSLDQTDTKIKARYSQLHERAIRISNDLEFFTLKISKISSNTQEKFLKASQLQQYRYFLSRLFALAKYLLSEPEEKIMNLKSKTSHSNWVEMTQTKLSKEERNGKSFPEIMNLLNDRDKKTRDLAAKWFNEIMENHVDTAEHEINSILENERIDRGLRGYGRPDHPRLISDGMEPEVVDTLLETVSERYDISIKYYELKSLLMELKKLQYHERNVPYGEGLKGFDFENSARTIVKAFNKKDPYFGELAKRCLREGRVDAFPKKGKISGAACISNLKTQPIFILLNHTDKVGDLTTLAHEMGHMIHAELIRENQSGLNDGSSLAVSEVASTLMESFVIDELVEQNPQEIELEILMRRLNDSVSSIQRQAACYKFEQELHRSFENKGYLSNKEIGKIFGKHMNQYMGEFVERSEGSQNWWVYWSHIRNFFYVYSYVSGNLIAAALKKKYEQDHSFMNNIKHLLSIGNSKAPMEAFNDIGIDIRNRGFWEEGLNEQEKMLERAWTLSKNLGKI